MTIILDDGSFEVGNSFVTTDEADDFCELRALSDWTSIEVTATKEAALIRAFDYLKVVSWSDTAFASGIPERVKEANIRAAVKEITSPGIMQKDEESNLKRKKIEGAIEKEYFEAGRFSGTIHNDILNLIKPYLASTSTSTTAGSQRYLVRR